MCFIIGTTFSGFSYVKYTDQLACTALDEVNVGSFSSNFAWDDNHLASCIYAKTPTALFYRTADDPDPLWGWSASNKATKKVYQPWQYQYRFKLRLADSHKDDPNIPPLPPGKTYLHVIADYLRIMRMHIQQVISKTGQITGAQDIKWCLTVPAQWSQKARADMHKAAEMAGMIRGAGADDNGGSIHALSLVLEPEAAGVFSLNKNVHPAAAAKLFVS